MAKETLFSDWTLLKNKDREIDKQSELLDRLSNERLKIENNLKSYIISRHLEQFDDESGSFKVESEGKAFSYMYKKGEAPEFAIYDIKRIIHQDIDI